jgi:hypothetical protein
MSTIIPFPQRRKLPAPPAPAPRKAPPVITLPALLRSVAPAADPFPERNGLTRYNSLVITHSSLPELPPGRYPDSLFDGIDIFAISPPESREELEEKIEDMDKEWKQDRTQHEIISEQHHFGVELVSGLKDGLETLYRRGGHVTKDDIKELLKLIGESMFET